MKLNPFINLFLLTYIAVVISNPKPVSSQDIIVTTNKEGQEVKIRWPKIREIMPDKDYTLAFPKFIPPTRMPASNGISSNIAALVELLNNDLKEAESVLKAKNYKISELKGGYDRQIVVKVPSQPVTWRVYPHKETALHSFRKDVFADLARAEDDPSNGYTLQSPEKADPQSLSSLPPDGRAFVKDVEDQQKVIWFGRNDGGEMASFFLNGQIESYSKNLGREIWLYVVWDEKGSLVSEKVKDRRSEKLKYMKKWVEEYKGEPEKKEWIRNIQRKISELEDNKK